MVSLQCDNLPKSAKAGAKGGGATPVQCNCQPDHRHAFFQSGDGALPRILLRVHLLTQVRQFAERFC